MQCDGNKSLSQSSALLQIEYFKSLYSGEAMVVAQTITLLLTDVISIAATYLATAAQGWPPPSGGGVFLQTPLGGRHAMHVFVEVMIL